MAINNMRICFLISTEKYFGSSDDAFSKKAV